MLKGKTRVEISHMAKTKLAARWLARVPSFYALPQLDDMIVHAKKKICIPRPIREGGVFEVLHEGVTRRRIVLRHAESKQLEGHQWFPSAATETGSTI